MTDIFVKNFSSATRNCMEDYMKISLRKNPNHIILHVGTIDLKVQHLKKRKLYLSKRGSNTVSSTFISELSRTLNWQRNKNNAVFIVKKCNSDKTNINQSVRDCNRVLKFLCRNNSNKLTFAKLNLNSIRNKCKFLFVRVRDYILEVMYSGFMTF